MRLSPGTRLRLGLVALALLVALTGCSFSPPKVCGVCGGEVEVAGENHGVNLTATSSEVHVYLRGDGSAKWVERIELNRSGAARLRKNATLRKRVLERATQYESAAPGTPDAVSVEGGALVVTYDVPKLAEPYPGGVLVVDRFHRQRSGSSFGYEVGADRAVLHAPDGMAVTNRPPASQWNRSAVVWKHSVATNTYVAFGPDRSRTTSWLTRAAIAAEVAGWASGPVAIASLATVSVLGFAAWTLLALFAGRDSLGVERPEFDLDDDVRRRLAAVSLVLLWGAVVVIVTNLSNSFGTLFWVQTVTAIILFAVLASVANRPKKVRWPVALGLVGTGPLLALGLVLDTGPGLSGYAAAVWSVLVSLVGAVVFAVLSLLSSR